MVLSMCCESSLSRRFLLGDQATPETIWNLQSMSVQGLARSSPEHGISEEDEMVVGVEAACQLFDAGAVNCTVRIVARLLVDGLPFLERIHPRHGYPLSSCEILEGV